jgi:hypothetical protein
MITICIIGGGLLTFILLAVFIATLQPTDDPRDAFLPYPKAKTSHTLHIVRDEDEAEMPVVMYETENN